MKKKYLLNHLKPGGRTLSVLVTLLVTAMTLLPQSVCGQTDYGLTVGGVVVTSENAESITGDNILGSVSFDPSTNTLTLSSASVSGTTISNGCIVSGLSNLNIVLMGSSYLDCSQDSCTAIRSVAKAALTITKGEEECSLSFNGRRAIRDFNSVTLSGLVWDRTCAYQLATINNNGSHTGMMLYDTVEDEIGEINIFDAENLPHPSMYASSNQQNEPTFGFEGDPSWEIRYSIDYVDESLADVTNALYNMQGENVPLQGAATVTAWTVFGDATSDVVKGKLFDLSETSLSTVYGTAETLSAPTLRPAIDAEDKITVSYLGREQSDVATINASTGEVTILGPGSETFNVDFSIDDGCTVLNYEDLTFDVTVQNSYSLFIGDTQVTEANADDVLGDGKVSFTVSGGQEAAPTYTLTLNGATLTQPIKVGLANLTFDIQETNSIITDETCIQKMDNTTPAVTFTSDGDVVGTLILKNTSDDLTGVNNIGEYGEGSFSISDQFALVLKRYGYIYSNQYYFTDGSTLEAKLSPSYGVTVGGMQICADNAADVIGDGIGGGDDSGMVSFDQETSTLTLTNASLSGIIRSSLPNLTIDLIGDNSIYSGGDRILQAGVPVNMTIQSSADVKGLLSMHKGYSTSEKGNFVDDNVNLTISAPLAVISGSLTDDVAKNDYYATIGVNYGITINTNDASVVITNQNRMDVLNDGNKTVQFDGRNTLILNRADIAGIVIGATSPLNTTDGLTVHLTGNNKITNGTKAIANEGNAMPLTLTTSDVEQGELEYICTTCTLTVANSAFSGFAPIKYNDNLAASLDAEANPQVVTIVAVMEPFVTQPGEEHKNTEDGNGLGLGVDIQQAIAGLSADAATTLLGEGVIVNKILYTLPGEADGYMVEDGGKVVALNTPMDDGEVNDILEYIKKGLIQPGTKLGDPYTFAYYFHGMSFLLPAGYGEISLDVNTNQSGELHVKVGNNDPVVISGTTGFEERRIPYALTEASYVFIYNVTSAPSSSRRSAGHRAPGRKETTTVGIKGLSVSASDVSPAPEPALSPKKLDKSLMIKEGNHITVNDMDIEDIEVDAFDELSGDITYVDLRQTSIKGMSVNRDDLFKKLPEKTFIYLPAGNEVITGTKNVVVGSVCNDMELDAAAPFEASKDFVAVKAVHARNFSTMLDKHCTVYLPFALDEEQASSLGTFYEMTGIADGKIMFTSVKETKANMPYMFKPAKETVSAKMVEVKATIPGAPVVGSATFEGTYDQKSILSDASTQYYCFKAEDGKLVHVIDNSMTVDPFRCYIKVTGGASLGRFLDIVVDDETTAVKNIKVGSEDNVYYDLSGRRVLYPKKGMYIMNGKKVIIK